MAESLHLKLEASKIGRISATARLIGTEFGTVTHIGPPNRKLKVRTFRNPKWRTAAILKNNKWPYLHNR